MSNDKSKPGFKTLSLYYSNVRNIACKLEQLHAFESETQFDIIAMTETWLNDHVTNGMLSCTGNYNIYRNDRKTLGGGVMLMVNSGLRVNKVNIPTKYKDLEILAIDVFGQRVSRFVVLYRPPSMINEVSKRLFECVASLLNVEHPVVVIGDFNLPDIKWKPFIDFPRESILYSSFIEMLTEQGLEQLVETYTRVDKHSGRESTLDLLLCTDSAFVYDVQVCEPVLTTDHSAIVFSCQGPLIAQEKTAQSIKFDYDKADWGHFHGHYHVLIGMICLNPVPQCTKCGTFL